MKSLLVERSVTNCHHPEPQWNSTMPSLGLHFTHDSICKSVSLLYPPLRPGQCHTLLEKQTKSWNSAAVIQKYTYTLFSKGTPSAPRMHLNTPVWSRCHGRWITEALLCVWREFHPPINPSSVSYFHPLGDTRHLRCFSFYIDDWLLQTTAQAGGLFPGGSGSNPPELWLHDFKKAT